MSNLKEIQNPVNPHKANILVSVIIVMLILLLTLQIWLMYGALNSAVTENHIFVWAAFGGSVLLFIIGLLLLKYLPTSKIEEVRDPDNLYE
jgi:uncharacterized protein YhhL (DUF1145 family)